MLPYLKTVLALAAIPGIAFATNVVTVVGTDDPAIDRPALQAAVDAAAPGTTLRLIGTFALDGERVLILTSDLVFAGEAIDDDGDGHSNEDWVDGSDNDGDGQIDEDDWNTVIRGVVDETGLPVLDDGVNGLFNRGLVVEGVAGTQTGLVIRDIFFTGHHRAVDLFPEWGTPTGRCEDRVFTGGELRHVLFEGNRFDNSQLGALGLGEVHQITAKRNLFVGNNIAGFLVEGGDVDCPLAGGAGADRLAIGTPTATSILSNRFFGTFGFGAATAETHGALIWDNEVSGSTGGLVSLLDEGLVMAGNRITDTPIGISLFETNGGIVLGNEVEGAFIGIEVDETRRVLVWNNRVSGALISGFSLTRSATQTTVFGNEIEDSFIGILLEFEGSGFKVINNSFSGSLFVDVSLDFDTSDNLVFNSGPTITAEDLGNDNRLLGNILLLP